MRLIDKDIYVALCDACGRTMTAEMGIQVSGDYKATVCRVCMEKMAPEWVG